MLDSSHNSAIVAHVLVDTVRKAAENVKHFRTPDEAGMKLGVTVGS